MEAPTFDLQSHSLHSDGELAPRDVVGAAVAAGVQLLSLTDHDTAAGVAEAAEAAADEGIGLVPGTEITSIWEGSQDLHVLGYLIDPDEATLVSTLERSRSDREHRAEAMAGALRELGYELDDAALARRAAEGRSIGRPHLAQAVVTVPGNHDRLASEGLLDPTEFLVAYLIEGKPAFRPRQAPTVQQAIELIHGAGGVAVWAHPFWDVKEPEAVLAAIDTFRDAGLDGVEAFYVTHTREQTELLVDYCAKLRLLSTGSSDFHGPHHHTFSKFRAFDTYGLAPVLGPIAAPTSTAS
ncbi:MAG TPA: PHP domain-containing protein [Solirubrobacteraceae bacterium]|nr:PHP domain-containing protein [Solirubrobacteraceae bacterium]